MSTSSPTPDHALALQAVGRLEALEGRFPAAVEAFAEAARLRPDSAEALADLGVALLAAGRPLHALPALQGAVQRQPDFAAAHAGLGVALERTGRRDEALAALEQAIALDASDAEAHYNRGVVLMALERLDEAIEAYRAALERRPDHALALDNLGVAQQRRGEFAAAASSHRAALHRDPAFVGACINLGNALQDAGDPGGAVSAYQRALALDPQHPEALLNLALAHLSNGDFAQGWRLFDARLANLPLDRYLGVPTGVPPWDRNLDTPRQLLLLAEGGFGDVIQFARFARLLRARGINPVLQCHPALRRLMSGARLFSAVVAEGAALPADRYAWCPLLSLPAAMVAGAALPCSAEPYLFAEEERVAHWRSRLGSFEGLRVGIAWQGNARTEHAALRGRSAPLAQFEPLARLPGITLVSLQKGAGVEQLDALPWAAGIARFDDLDAGGDAFVDTAALIANLDLVVSTDTAVAHLAGALGAPVWIALNATPDWRWMRARSDSPWYASARLFRQETFGAWDGVFAAIARALDAAREGGIRRRPR